MTHFTSRHLAFLICLPVVLVGLELCIGFVIIPVSTTIHTRIRSKKISRSIRLETLRAARSSVASRVSNSISNGVGAAGRASR